MPLRATERAERLRVERERMIARSIHVPSEAANPRSQDAPEIFADPFDHAAGHAQLHGAAGGQDHDGQVDRDR